MKKLLLLLFALVLAIGADAQNGITNEHRFGVDADTTRCLQAISISTVNVRNKDYATAYPHWKIVFTEFPVARVDTYTNGIKILTELINAESDPQKKEDYIQELLSVYDQEIRYIDKLQEITNTPLSAGQLYGRRVMEFVKYYPESPVDTLYAMFAKAVDMEKGMSEYTVTERFMKYSALKYKQDPNHGEQIIEDYLAASVYIVEVLDKYHDNIERSEQRYRERGNPRDSTNAIAYSRMIDASRIAKSNIDAYFINSGAATCEDLNNIYTPLLEANSNNLEYLNKVISVMSMLRCTEQDAYMIASEYAFALEPTAKAAMGCGYRYFKKGEIDRAMEFFDQAIELETSITTKAELCYKVGAVNLSLGRYGKARSYAQKALSYNSKYGMPHILIAQCYAANPNWCDDGMLNACTYFVCIDRLERAKAVDPSIKREADRLINTYRGYTPKKEDLFMRGYSTGTSVNVGGWINETTTIR